MRKLSAHYILSPGLPPLPKAVLEIDDDGTILNLRPGYGSQKEEDKLEFYSGILVPGFVNVHTHLELSHLHRKIDRGTGLSEFIRQVIKKRTEYQLDPGLILKRMAQMRQQGTVAVGDISNSLDSLDAKKKSDLYTHSFVELFGLNPALAQQIWNEGKKVHKGFASAGLSTSLSPHAPYSLSEALWQKLRSHEKKSDLVSIHHQESPEEQDLMSSHTGKMARAFIRQGIDPDLFPGPVKSTPQWILPRLPKASGYLFVHNTLSQNSDLELIRQEIESDKTFFALCPNANQFIENALPSNMIGERHNLQLCIGTDSLASNEHLSVLEEIKTLTNNFPELNLSELITWATLNGAKALGIGNRFGSFERGKQPGVVLLEKLDISGLKMTDECQSRSLL